MKNMCFNFIKKKKNLINLQDRFFHQKTTNYGIYLKKSYTDSKIMVKCITTIH